MANALDGGRVTQALHRQRYRIVLWIAVIEAVIAWVGWGLHAWTIVVLGLVALASLMLHGFLRERTSSPFLRQFAWLLAASQLGATVAVAAGYIVWGALVVIVVIFALIALGLLLLERR